MSKKIFSNYKKYWVTKPIKTIPSSLDFDVDLLGADKNIHVLDIGCGNGNLLMELSKKGFSHLYGVDINLNQPFSLVSNIYLSNQDANHLEFKDEMFDATVMKALLTVVVSDY